MRYWLIFVHKKCLSTPLFKLFSWFMILLYGLLMVFVSNVLKPKAAVLYPEALLQKNYCLDMIFYAILFNGIYVFLSNNFHYKKTYDIILLNNYSRKRIYLSRYCYLISRTIIFNFWLLVINLILQRFLHYETAKEIIINNFISLSFYFLFIGSLVGLVNLMFENSIINILGILIALYNAIGIKELELTNNQRYFPLLIMSDGLLYFNKEPFMIFFYGMMISLLSLIYYNYKDL